MNWLLRVDMMYSNIFTDLQIDDRRMKKRAKDTIHVADIPSASYFNPDDLIIKPINAISINLPLSTDPLSYGAIEQYQGNNKTTRTTTTFTPGNTKMAEAMAVKSVADNLLMATGTVIGGTWGLLAAARTGKPQTVLGGAKSGKKIGQTVGSWMWNAIN